MRCAEEEFLVVFQGDDDLDHGLKVVLGNESRYIVAGVDINGSASFCPQVRVGTEVVAVNGMALASCESAEEAEDALKDAFGGGFESNS